MTLVDTKERGLPAHPAQTPEDYLIYLKHLALYRFASASAHQRVLDLGCGEGYGSDALAHTAHFVVAADYEWTAVAHARRKYPRANLAFVACDAQTLPFRAESFETVISFEVIEHIPAVRKYLAEIKRVTTARGIAILSTPNRLLRLLPFQKPWNRFHLREYAARDFERVVGATFSRVQLRGITAIPAILEIEKRRVKQNLLIAYPKMIAQMVLPNGVYDWLKQVKSRVYHSAAARAATFDAAKFTVDDFRVSENELRECINLIAISGG